MTSLSISTFFQLQEEERYRLAHSLMDGPGQILANTLIELEHSVPLIESDPVAAANGLAALSREVRDGLAHLKSLVAELQPALLAEMGLAPALSQYVRDFGSRNGIEVIFRDHTRTRERLPSTIEIAVFRIVQEALANVLEHSGATCVKLSLSTVSDGLKLSVEDNGQGFRHTSDLRSSQRQLGLVGMFDRANLVGGQLQIYSEQGKGVNVVITVPYHAHEISDSAPGGKDENRGQSQDGRKKTGTVIASEVGHK